MRSAVEASGVEVDVVVRCVAGSGGSGRPDVLASRTAVALVRPGASAAGAGDTYDVDYCLGPEATEKDVFTRAVAPLLHALVGGQNVCLLAMGASGAGKTASLEGPAPGRPGVVHYAAKVRSPYFSGPARKRSHPRCAPRCARREAGPASWPPRRSSSR